MRVSKTAILIIFGSIFLPALALANTAPTLDDSKIPALAAQTEDAGPPTGAVGTVVSGNLVDSSSIAGGLDNVDDPDAGDPLGIALIDADGTNGAWYYSIASGPWFPVAGSLSISNALLLSPDARLYFRPAANFEGSSSISFQAWDGSTGSAGQLVSSSTSGGTSAFSVASDSASINVTGVNDAPVLDSAATPTLSSIAHDAPLPAGLVGTPVSSLVDFSSLPGGLDNVSDADAGALLGIAVTSADSANGNWFFTTSGGGSWSPLGSVSDASALLLDADSNNRLYFHPTSGFSGTSSIAFRAWDSTSGTAGSVAAIASTGGTTPFSVNSDDAVITVLAPPGVTITSVPAEPTNDTTPTFHFVTSGVVDRVRCRIDGTSADDVNCFEDFTAAVTLLDGPHTFHVTASNVVGESATDSRAFTLDTNAPDTMLLTTPPPGTNQQTASFSFDSEPGVTFECSVDFDPFAPCSSPYTTGTLSEGSHTFKVRAVDAAGNADPTPAAFSWLIDLTSPVAAIDGTPSDPSSNPHPNFFFSSEPDASFYCRIDANPFVPCTSPYATFTLSETVHTFFVRATDLVGNVQTTPTSFQWTVDLTPPNANITPVTPTATSVVSFALTSSEAASFECNLDSAGFAACPPSYTTPALAEGPHQLDVRATDSAGNADPTPAHFAWVCDTVPPDTMVTTGAAGANGTPADFAFTSTELPSTFECSLDGGSFLACTSPYSPPFLTEGDHVFFVRAVDVVGNVDPTPADFSWSVDLTASVKCEMAIAKSSARLVQARAKALSKCNAARIAGKAAFSTDCSSDAKTVQFIEKAEAKMVAAIAKACGGSDKTCGGGSPGEQSPASLNWPSTCPGFLGEGCTNAISDCSGIVECLQCIDAASVGSIIEISFGSLPQTDPASDADLNKCQLAFGKSTARYLASRSKALQGCWIGRIRGQHLNSCPDPGDGKAEATIAAADATRKASLCKACGGPDGICDGNGDVSPYDILGGAQTCPSATGADGHDCGAYGTIDNLTSMRDCSGCLADFVSGCADLGAVPQLASYPSGCVID